MLGSSVFMVSAALFYTRVVGLSVAQVGIGLGIGGLVGLLSGVPVGRVAMSLQGDVVLFALPLWIVGHTHVPRFVVGATGLMSTVLVVALQVRIGRHVTDSASAARAWRRSGWAFLAGMALMAVTGALPGGPAAVLVLAGVGVHTLGEILQAAGSFELRYALAPAHAQGQYSGVFGFGGGIAGVAAPALLGWLCISWGAPGWFLLGAVFVLTGSAVPWVVRRAGLESLAPADQPVLKTV
ncbi:hypothetical protein C7C46_01875 [Streptomyces tateyamensis]|uniref:Uncharacterized protein n=2 Tax=Streptomyces tateyamensis TaxID=565073 RepID=A0A2V4P366_9ACTN|nr:hypothetical protein C7C46_01875 [Streptomyces tateyamensis]